MIIVHISRVIRIENNHPTCYIVHESKKYIVKISYYLHRKMVSLHKADDSFIKWLPPSTFGIAFQSHKNLVSVR